jgi:hypothetical protein
LHEFVAALANGELSHLLQQLNRIFPCQIGNVGLEVAAVFAMAVAANSRNLAAGRVYRF